MANSITPHQHQIVALAGTTIGLEQSVGLNSGLPVAVQNLLSRMDRSATLASPVLCDALAKAAELTALNSKTALQVLTDSLSTESNKALATYFAGSCLSQFLSCFGKFGAAYLHHFAPTALQTRGAIATLNDFAFSPQFLVVSVGLYKGDRGSLSNVLECRVKTSELLVAARNHQSCPREETDRILRKHRVSPPKKQERAAIAAELERNLPSVEICWMMRQENSGQPVELIAKRGPDSKPIVPEVGFDAPCALVLSQKDPKAPAADRLAIVGFEVLDDNTILFTQVQRVPVFKLEATDEADTIPSASEVRVGRRVTPTLKACIDARKLKRHTDPETALNLIHWEPALLEIACNELRKMGFSEFRLIAATETDFAEIQARMRGPKELQRKYRKIAESAGFHEEDSPRLRYTLTASHRKAA